MCHVVTQPIGTQADRRGADGTGRERGRLKMESDHHQKQTAQNGTCLKSPLFAFHLKAAAPVIHWDNPVAHRQCLARSSMRIELKHMNDTSIVRNGVNVRRHAERGNQAHARIGAVVSAGHFLSSRSFTGVHFAPLKS